MHNRFNGFILGELTMSHSLTKVWIHGVWSTKDRTALLKKGFRSKVLQHIQEKFDEINCPAQIVNGTSDHIHALFVLNSDKCVAEVIKMVKGESSHWINQHDFLKIKFAWQVGYCGLSVSESRLKQVEMYIRNQEEHHRKMTFQEEYNFFLEKCGLSENR